MCFQNKSVKNARQGGYTRAQLYLEELLEYLYGGYVVIPYYNLTR